MAVALKMIRKCPLSRMNGTVGSSGRTPTVEPSPSSQKRSFRNRQNRSEKAMKPVKKASLIQRGTVFSSISPDADLITKLDRTAAQDTLTKNNQTERQSFSA